MEVWMVRECELGASIGLSQLAVCGNCSSYKLKNDKIASWWQSCFKRNVFYYIHTFTAPARISDCFSSSFQIFCMTVKADFCWH